MIFDPGSTSAHLQNMILRAGFLHISQCSNFCIRASIFVRDHLPISNYYPSV